MKKIKYIASICFILLLVSMVSCESDDEFLTEDPMSFYTVGNAFSSAIQIDQELITIYAQIRELWANPNEAGWIFVLRGNGTDMFDVPAIRRNNTFNNYGNINPENGNIYSVYSTFYAMIARANLALYSAELPQISWSSAADKTYAIAQARFFRAFAYRNLGELFGGVPIVTDISTTPKYDFKRATRVETYQFAITELEAIEADLPETTTIGGRVVKGAAQHNLCELYLALGTQLAADGKTAEANAAFAKSITYGDKVIDGGTYKLMTSRFGTRKSVNSIAVNVYQGGVASAPVDTVLMFTNHYWDLFQEGNQNFQEGNTECIWAAQVDYSAYKAEDKASKLPYSRTFGPVFRDGGKTYLTGTLEDVGGRGISQIIPTMYTRDEIYTDKWGKDIRNSNIVFRRRFKGNIANTKYFKQEIPWSFFYTGGVDQTANDYNRSLCYPVSCKISTDKYTGVADGENMSNLFRDEYIIRLPETILLRAEAKQRSGNKAGAAMDINLLRKRAQCAYEVTAADMDDNFNMILNERARELVYEECRWNTLLRMGGTVATDRIKKYAYWPEAAATLTFNYNLWPIPQKAIDTNKDVKLEQNPGWINR